METEGLQVLLLLLLLKAGCQRLHNLLVPPRNVPPLPAAAAAAAGPNLHLQLPQQASMPVPHKAQSLLRLLYMQRCRHQSCTLLGNGRLQLFGGPQ